MDAEGTRTHLPRILKVAELRAQGKSREEIQRFVADAFAKGIFQPPSRPGVDYMLSTQNLVPNEKGIVVPFPPHVMFYAPYLTNAELGVDRTDLGPDGNPHAAAFCRRGGHPSRAHHRARRAAHGTGPPVGQHTAVIGQHTAVKCCVDSLILSPALQPANRTLTA
jgi:hypothetical protein